MRNKARIQPRRGGRDDYHEAQRPQCTCEYRLYVLKCATSPTYQNVQLNGKQLERDIKQQLNYADEITIGVFNPTTGNSEFREFLSTAVHDRSHPCSSNLPGYVFRSADDSKVGLNGLIAVLSLIYSI